MPRELALVVLLLLLVSSAGVAPIVASGGSVTECYTLYFLDGIVVYNSTISADVVLETPTNTQLLGGIEQVVEHVNSYNVTFNESLRAYSFKLREGEFFEGFFLSKVHVCSRPLNTTWLYTTLALFNPKYSPAPQVNASFSTNVSADYLKTPHDKVVKNVIPEYEKWFSEHYGFTTRNASLLGIATTLSYFIQRVYLKYSAGVLPRSIDSTVEERQGDCDDMARVTVEALNYYGIPAAVVSGYVYVDGFNYTIPVENTTYIFVNNGPHAFPIAHVPGVGWIPLDWLAGAFTYYPFIVESITRNTEAPSEEEVEEFLEVHRALSAVQVIAVVPEATVKEYVNSSLGALYLWNNLKEKAVVTLSTKIPRELAQESTLTPRETVQVNTTTYTTELSNTSTLTATTPLSEQGAITSLGLITLILLLVVVLVYLAYSRLK